MRACGRFQGLRGWTTAQARYGNYSPCKRILWKKRHMNSYFMKKTAPKIVFYGNYSYFMEILCHFYGNLLYFMEILCHFMEICCDLRKFCVTGVSDAGRPLVPKGVFSQAFRGWSGSVGAGWTRSGRVAAQPVVPAQKSSKVATTGALAAALER